MSYRGGAGGDQIDVRLDGSNGVTVTASGTPGVWVQLIAANNQRSWVATQNQDDTAVAYVVPAATQPGAGTAQGELKIPANAFYDFDFSVQALWWVRTTVASSKLGLWNA